jgi:hypothetical protein
VFNILNNRNTGGFQPLSLSAAVSTATGDYTYKKGTFSLVTTNNSIQMKGVVNFLAISISVLALLAASDGGCDWI